MSLTSVRDRWELTFIACLELLGRPKPWRER